MAHGATQRTNTARILVYDIEIAPIIGTVWQKYESNIIWSIQDWYMLCFAYKWLGERKTTVVAQPDFKGYKRGSPDDSKLVRELHRLFDEADVVVAHNGDQFDQKKANARFVINHLGPASPYHQVDTLKIARKYFGFTSNKLADLATYLGIPDKLPTQKELWRDCMAGDEKAWRYMMRYNKRDVVVLEQVYLRLLPWDVSHPNRANIEGRPGACPRCGVEGFLQAQGVRYTKTGQYRRWQCKSCRSYVSDRKAEKTDKPEFV